MQFGLELRGNLFFSDKLCYFFPQTFTGLTQRSFQPITPWKTRLPLTEAFPAILILIYFFKVFQSLWRSLTLFLIFIFMLYPPDPQGWAQQLLWATQVLSRLLHSSSQPGRTQSWAFPAESLLFIQDYLQKLKLGEGMQKEQRGWWAQEIFPLGGQEWVG